MLHIIAANQEALRRRLVALAERKQPMLVIVPEQYTLQTERDLMDGLGAPGFFDLEVLSPSRLTERVFASAGADSRVRIDARGKQFALAQALIQNGRKLKYYESAAEKQGFIQRLGALIADFKRAGVTPQALTDYAAGLPEGAEQEKMRDLALLYTAYQNRLAARFVDGEDVLESMLRRLPESGLARDRLAAVYGFDVFTGQMNRLLMTLARESGEVYALVQMGQEDFFSPVRESVRRLRDAAAEAGVPCRLSQLPPAFGDQQPELRHLSAQYLRMPGQVYSAPAPGIRLYAAPSPWFEAHFAAQEMLLLHESGMAFGEMAAAMGDPGFAGTLASVLRSYRIPAYVARKLPAASHGAARFLLASLRALSGGWDADDMLSLIKSGFAPIEEEDAWRLENYVLSYGIRGKMWLSPFTRGSSEECTRLEDARAALMGPLQTLKERFRGAENAGAALKALYDYLTETGLPRRLAEAQEALLARDMAAEAVQARQIWDAITQLLSQAWTLLSDAAVSPRHLAAWLEAGLDACELSSLPPAADAVMCGEIGSLPLARPRALFLMNLTDGLLAPPAPGLMTPQEQENAEAGLHAYLSLSPDGQDALRHLDVWKALSAPREKLYLTRSQATQEGAALRPFASLKQIRRLFPMLAEEGGVSQKAAALRPLAPLPALDALGAKARDRAVTGEWLSAWRYLAQAPETAARAGRLKAAFLPDAPAAPLPREITRELFMERVMSVSRLESFAVCPYRHFIEQGLAPRPRQEWTVTPIDAGNFYHAALEGFTRLLPSVPGWPRIGREACDALVERAARPMLDQLLSGAMGDSARLRAQGDRYMRVLRRVAWTFTRGARQSAFSPQDAEVRFGYPGGIPPVELTLKDGSRVFVRGIIDRIDRYAGDEGVYLRVVDYKSGGEKLDPARVFWGAQLQLLLYLRAALAMEADARPAGAFYMRVYDPLLPDPDTAADIEDALARALSLRGVALRDAAILRRMDEGTPPLTLPKVLSKDGSFDQRAMLASLEDMYRLIRHAEKTAAQLALRMQSGEIAAAPLCDKNLKGPCELCDYASVCRRDVRRSPGDARILPGMDFGALLEKLDGDG